MKTNPLDIQRMLLDIPIDRLDRLAGIFKAHGWEGPVERDRLDRLVALMSHLTDEGQELVLDLTADFLHFSLPFYSAAVDRVVDEILRTFPQNLKDVALLPLFAPKHHGQVKSGDLVAYIMKGALSNRGVRCLDIDRPELLNVKRPGRGPFLVLMVDDFIGTGETALAARDDFLANHAVANDELAICALVAQEEGVRHVRAKGVRAIVDQVRKKGISESTRISDRKAAAATMEEIEDAIGVFPDFRFGYGRSEALVAMSRCPNNTFPVFWLRPKGDTSWTPPFPRGV